MPIDWGSRETIFRLLAAAFAAIGKEGFKGTYGEIARLFGEPATYDAIQCQFREVSKMAECLRSGQGGTQNRQRSVKALRTARRSRNQSSSLDLGDLEVICEGREDSVHDEGPGVHHQERANKDRQSPRLPPSKGWARTSPPVLTSKSLFRGSTNPRDEEFVCGTPVRLASAGVTTSAKLIPKMIVIPDQVTTFFKTESTTHVASAVQWNRTTENPTRSSMDPADERPQFRKLCSSDACDTRGERVEEHLDQDTEENASEMAQYHSLYSVDQAKNTVTPLQEFLEVRSTATNRDQQEQKQEGFMSHATQLDNVPGTTRHLSKNLNANVMKDGGGSSDEMIEPRENNALPIPSVTGSRKFDTTSGPVTSWMHLDTRKCLLCDGRKFPGDAFYKHERESRRHRDNLRNEDKVVKAEARLQKISNRRLLHHFSESTESTNGPPPQGHNKLRQQKSKAEFPGQRGRDVPPSPLEQNSVAVAGGLYNKDEVSSQPTEVHVVKDLLVGKTAPPLKRKRLAIEPEDGDSSTQPNTKRARAIPRNSEARDDVLVQMSSADLEKLLRLHPDIFDKKWNQRSTPAPPGWQAIGPSTSQKTGDGTKTAPYRRQSRRSEEVQIIGSRACLRKSSEMARDYFQTSSRCDDSADSDYREEEDEDEAEDDD